MDRHDVSDMDRVILTQIYPEEILKLVNVTDKRTQEILSEP